MNYSTFRTNKLIQINLLFFLLIVSGACSFFDKNNEIPILTSDNLKTNELTLSDISTNIKYLKLDNSALISKILDIEKSDSYFLINSLNGIHLFDNNGRFVRQIGKKGKGPGEYSNAYDITLDNKSEHIYVLGNKMVYVYNFEGLFLFSFPTYEQKHFKRMIYRDSKLYFPAAYDVAEKLNYQWVITDETGKLISLKNNSAKDVEIRVSLKTNICFEEENKLCYWNQLNDTIFYIDDKIGCPAYLFDNGKFKITAADLEKEETFRNKSLWNLLSVFGTSKYLVFDYLNIKDKVRMYSVYDKKSGQFYELNKLALGNEMAFLNSFDSGPAFMPKTKISDKSGEWFVNWIDAYQLNAHIASESFKNLTPKFPEKKKQLEKLASSLDENDNPVLMLVKLKE